MGGRELRMVRKDWEHPKDHDEHYIPLEDGYNSDLKGFVDRIKSHGVEDAIEYYGGGPRKEGYMPDWDKSERAHFMMYEDVSEGTPISPPFSTPEELAKWLNDTGASAFADITATYDQWLSMIKGSGSAPGMIIQNGIMESGVGFGESEQ